MLLARELAVALTVLAVFTVGCSTTPDPGDGASNPQGPDVDETSVATAPLTGVELDGDTAAALTDRPVVAVKVPNDPSARPQTGLEQADIVFEQVTEYGVTRFVALFHSSMPDRAGNVRSARFVDIDLLAPFEPVAAFSGARQEVRDAITTAGLTTVTEGHPAFSRDSARQAPHNLYVDPSAVAATDAADPASPVGWDFDPDLPDGGRPVDEQVTVQLSDTYQSGFTYDRDAGVWRRYQNGTYHEVTGPDAIGAANVVIVQAPTDGHDDHGGVRYTLEGTTGDATLLRDGHAFDLTWTKPGRDRQFEFDLPLAPGPTWVVLAPEHSPVTGVGDTQPDS